MFRVKKEDYNSVQFLPEYNSGSARGARLARSGGGKKLLLVILIIIVLSLAAAAAGGYIYFTYYTPANQFLTAFEEQDYTSCQQISEENAFDSAFVTSIQDAVTGAADETFSSYKSGSMTAAEATELINTYNTSSGGCFKEALDVVINNINTAEAVRTSLTDAQNTMASGQYLAGLSQLMTVSSSAAENGLDLEGDIASVIETNRLNIKSALFEEFSSLIRNASYDQIISYIDFIAKYDSDTDYTEFRALTEEVRNGQAYIRNARRQAQSIVKETNAAIEEQQAAQ